MSHPVTTVDPFEPTLPEDQDWADATSEDGEAPQKFAFCPECKQIVLTETTGFDLGDGNATWETVCVPHRHLISED